MIGSFNLFVFITPLSLSSMLVFSTGVVKEEVVEVTTTHTVIVVVTATVGVRLLDTTGGKPQMCVGM